MLRAESTHSGQNVDNALRQNFRTILEPKNKKLRAGWTKDELEAVREFTKGTITSNSLREIGNRLGGNLGLWSAISGHSPPGQGIPHVSLGAMALFGTGRALKGMGNALQKRKAAELSRRLASRSPLAEKWRAQGLREPDKTPLQLTVGTATYGAPALDEYLNEQQGGRVEGYSTDSPEFKEEVRLALLRNPDHPTRKQAQVNRRNYLPDSPASVNIEDRRQRGGAVKITSQTGTHSIPVEIASTAAQQAKGLSGRRTLGKGRGMLFKLSSNRPTSFWMNKTNMPLDMIFIRADGRIARIAENRKPLSRERVLSGGPVNRVLEVAAGTARKWGLRPGDKVQ